jgi:AraC-like DNA-binding protein
MEPLEAREGREAIKDSRKVWRPWQLNQLELLQGVAVSFPSYQRFTQEYLLISWHAGTLPLHQYRNTRLSGPLVDGKCLVIEPGETWRCQGKDVTFHSLSIDPAWLQQFAAEMLHREKRLPHFSSYPLFDLSLSRAVRDLATRSQAPASRLQQEETLLSLLAPLLFSHAEDAGVQPQPGREHPAIKRAKEYLQEHYAQEVALQELARVANLSPFHLSRVFHQAVGLPPHMYQTQLRLERAKKLLAQGFDVSYVAMETGFCDQSHLAQQFKRNFLVTAGSYRKTARFF